MSCILDVACHSILYERTTKDVDVNVTQRKLAVLQFAELIFVSIQSVNELGLY